MVRRICIALVVLGTALLFLWRDNAMNLIPVVPLPAEGLSVKARAHIANAGDYLVDVTMPKVKDSFTLDRETISCSLVISVLKDGAVVAQQKISSLGLYSEFVHGRIQFFHGGDFLKLSSGECWIEVRSLAPCKEAAERGATVSLKYDAPGDPSSNAVVALLKSVVAVLALAGGLLGLVICEFQRPNKAPEPTPGAVTPRATEGTSK